MRPLPLRLDHTGQYFPYYHTLTRSVIAHISIGHSLPALDTQPACGLDI